MRACGASAPTGVSGFEWFIVILAFLADLSGYGLIGNRRQTAR